MSLHALPGKWRELADSLEGSVADAVEYRDTLRNCADELAAALAGGGEAIAWCKNDDPVNHTAFSWTGTDRNPVHTTPLFTHPAGDVQADLKGLTDAADYLARNPGDAYALSHFKQRLAAINPGGSRE